MVKKVYKFSHISLSTSSKDSRVLPIASQVYEILNNAGIKVSFDNSLLDLQRKLKKRSNSEAYIVKNSQLLIAIGGDGTMLNCSRRYGSQGIPILGINLGKVGFLTDISPNEIENLFFPVLKGDFKSSTRFLLEASVYRNSRLIGADIAVNDIALHPGMAVKMMSFELNVDGEFVYSQSSDGLIVASPTGSTAYSLSAGGPLVYPTLNAMVVVPMNPHTLSSRPIVLDSASVIDITVSETNKLNPVVTCDGQNDIVTMPGDVITISRYKDEITLIHPQNSNFYDACRSKLGWGSKLSS